MRPQQCNCVCAVGPTSTWRTKKERCERGWKRSPSRPRRPGVFCGAKERDTLSEAPLFTG